MIMLLTYDNVIETVNSQNFQEFISMKVYPGRVTYLISVAS